MGLILCVLVAVFYYIHPSALAWGGRAGVKGQASGKAFACRGGGGGRQSASASGVCKEFTLDT